MNNHSCFQQRPTQIKSNKDLKRFILPQRLLTFSKDLIIVGKVSFFTHLPAKYRSQRVATSARHPMATLNRTCKAAQACEEVGQWSCSLSNAIPASVRQSNDCFNAPSTVLLLAWRVPEAAHCNSFHRSLRTPIFLFMSELYPTRDRFFLHERAFIIKE